MLKKKVVYIHVEVAGMDELEMLYGRGLQSKKSRNGNPKPIKALQSTQTSLSCESVTFKNLYVKALSVKDPFNYEKSGNRTKKEAKQKKEREIENIILHC